MSESKYIYAFVHIPKTAGTTFRYHIVKYLKKDEHLYLGADSLGLWDKKRGANPEDAKKAVINKLQNTKNLDKLRVIYGHLVVYGIDKYLPKPVRYFTFVRQPVQRTISMYNHYREQYESLGKNIEKGNDYNILVDGKMPSFSEWLDKKYSKKNKNNYLTMQRKLMLNGFLNQDKGSKKEIDQALKKFWFIGTVSNFDEDSLFLYHKIGINAFFVNQNISKKYFKLTENPRMIDKITKGNKQDILIYDKAKKYHDKILGRQKNFNVIVRRMRVKKHLLLPFTQTLYAPKDTMKLVFNKALNKMMNLLQIDERNTHTPLNKKFEGNKGIRIMGHRKYVGGRWDELGKLQFDFLIKNKLKRNNVLLDVGCGSLRAGVYLIPYLDKGNYLGIEKEKKLIEAGIENELGHKLNKEKKPELIVSNSFEFEKFRKKPDFVIAQSLFTHLNISDIQRCMKNLRRFVKKNTVLYATYFKSSENGTNPEKSHDHKAFAYTKAQMKNIGNNNGWSFNYVGDWGHPRNQVMVMYKPQ